MTMVDFSESCVPREPYAVLCYLPPADYIGLDRFANNMEEFPAAARTIFYSDTESEAAKRLKARKVEAIPNGDMTPVDIGSGMRLPPAMSWVPSTYAFLDGLRIAVEEKLDCFFYLETDCRVNRKGWDQVLWVEHLRWPGGCVTSGTPAIWNPWAQRGAWRDAIANYVLRYRRSSGLPMPFCGPNKVPLNVYPNGALAFYKTAEVQEAFQTALAASPRGPEALKCMPYDYRFGEHLMKKYGVEVFKKVGFLPSSYSGCGNILMPEIQRMRMLVNKTKVAVHQIKSNAI